MSATLAHKLLGHYALHVLRSLVRPWSDPPPIAGNMDLCQHEGEPPPAFVPDVLVAWDMALEATAVYRF